MGTWANPSGPRSRALPYLAGAGLAASLAASGGCGWAEGSTAEPAPVLTVTATAGTSAIGSCPLHPLSDLCGVRACPATEEDVRLRCGSRQEKVTTKRYEMPCGNVLEHQFVDFFEQWHFDASGVLSGFVTSAGSTECPFAGTGGPMLTYGTVCAPTAAPRDLCLEACPVGFCTPRASILTDFPLALSDAPNFTINVCRAAECYSAELPRGLELGQEIQLVGNFPDGKAAPPSPLTVRVWFGPGSTAPLELHLTWELHQGNFPPNDRYLVTLVRGGVPRPDPPVLDAQVLYETVDLGCGGTCRVADLDLRAAAATMAP